MSSYWHNVVLVKIVFSVELVKKMNVCICLRHCFVNVETELKHLSTRSELFDTVARLTFLLHFWRFFKLFPWRWFEIKAMNICLSICLTICLKICFTNLVTPMVFLAICELFWLLIYHYPCMMTLILIYTWLIWKEWFV